MSEEQINYWVKKSIEQIINSKTRNLKPVDMPLQPRIVTEVGLGL